MWCKNSNELKIPPKAQGSRVPLVRAVYHDLLGRVAACSNQGRSDGVKGKIPRAQRSPNNVTSTVLQRSTFASERPHVRTWGHQTCFLPRAPSNLVTHL